MAKVKLSKSSLQQQRSQMKLYQKLLPSLDLRRRQLLLELKSAEQALEKARQAVEALESRIGAELPMLAAADNIPLEGLVEISDIQVGRESVAGVSVPKLESISCRVASYSMLVMPAWVDRLVERLKDAAEQRLWVSVYQERVRILTQAVRRTTQRMNLFDRILIPQARENIKRIQIYLGELDREAVIRSKLAKARHA